MQFTSRADIDAPIEDVFAEVSDVAAFERLARRRGVEVQRTDTLAAPGPGMGWHARFTWRERLRALDLTLVVHDPPSGVAFDLASNAIKGRLEVDLVALSPARTRLVVDLSVEARGLAGRLMLQPVKLMRGNLDRRFQVRVSEYAHDIEDRFKSRV